MITIVQRKNLERKVFFYKLTKHANTNCVK